MTTLEQWIAEATNEHVMMQELKKLGYQEPSREFTEAELEEMRREEVEYHAMDNQ